MEKVKSEAMSEIYFEGKAGGKKERKKPRENSGGKREGRKNV